MLLTQASQGDLPSLLDTLTVAVTTLDAVGIDSYKELYLYVMGSTQNDIVRDLRLEDGQLIVGPPMSNLAYPAFMDRDFEANRRALLLADLCYIMRIWRWSAPSTAKYLHCSEAMLTTWIARSGAVDVPVLPHAVIDRIKRLCIVDQARYLAGVSDNEMPGWLSARRPGFGRRSVEQVLQGGDAADYTQLVMWGLNSHQQSSMLH